MLDRSRQNGLGLLGMTFPTASASHGGNLGFDPSSTRVLSVSLRFHHPRQSGRSAFYDYSKNDMILCQKFLLKSGQFTEITCPKRIIVEENL